MQPIAVTRLDLSFTLEEFDAAGDRGEFIGAKVFPPRGVQMKSADVGKIPKEAVGQIVPLSRAPGGGYRRDEWEPDTFSYNTEEKAREGTIDDVQVKVFGDLFDVEVTSTNRVLDQVLRGFEAECAAAAYNTAVWTGAGLTTALTKCWDVFADATPIADIDTIRDGMFYKPNALILNEKQWRKLCRCEDLLERLGSRDSNDPKIARMAAVAELLQLKYILVAGGRKNTANPAKTASFSQIWSDSYAMLARVAETDDPREPCLGRSFFWTAEVPAAPGSDEQIAVVTETYRDERVRGDVARCRSFWGITPMYVECGHLISNVLTPPPPE